MCKERFDIVDGDGNGVAMIKGPNCPLYTLGGKVPRQYFIALQHYYLIGDKVANATVYKYIYLTIIKCLKR
jgi:hypothetical protein